MISVCIATHNGEKYIKEQIDSILCQLGPDDEVVISDDSSKDNTLFLLDNYRDSRIKVHYFKQPTKSKHLHTYVSRNFENALKYATGDIIFLSDQDDWWMPYKVEKCVLALKEKILVVHQAELCDNELNPTGELMYKDSFVFNNYLSIKTGKYYGCTLAFRKELLDYILPFPTKLLLHDHWIGCMAELKGSVYYDNTPLIKYRRHSNNTSSKSTNSIWFKVWYRIYMFKHLMLRRAVSRPIITSN